MQQSKQNLQKTTIKNLLKNQKNASSKMKDLAKKLNNMQQQANQQQQEEDINSLKNILESLMTLSFNQESLMNDFSQMNSDDPKYRKKGKRTKKKLSMKLKKWKIV